LQKEDVHILNLQTVTLLGLSTTAESSKNYLPISRTNKYKSIINPLAKKLYMVPIHAGGHFSLLIFWRLDLLYTDESKKACILWFDSIHDFHYKKLQNWKNILK
jgi:Ulp1 family protease